MGEAEGDLSFKKDDILFVDESLPKGSFGTWMAWQLDENAQKIQRGQIPSKYMWVANAAHTRTHTSELAGVYSTCEHGVELQLHYLLEQTTTGDILSHHGKYWYGGKCCLAVKRTV